jgi:hypothetical protein
MKEYGLDGVFVQRFFHSARPGDHKRNQVLRHAIEAASKYERACAVMYDLSGLKASGEDCSSLIEDWKYLVDSMKVTNQAGAHTYLFYNGKPLVTIWGLGFPDRPYNIRNIGTAIFKVTDSPPVSKVAKFAGMDGKPSDYYLFLTGEAAKMLRREKPLSLDMPKKTE